MKKIWRYLIATSFCAIVALIYMLAKDVFNQTDAHTLYKDLCSAFFAPGILMVLFAGLMFCTNEGALDMLAFGIIKLFDLFKKKDQVKYHTYYDYKESKKDKKTSKGTITTMIVVGAVFILLSMPFLIINRV